MDGMPDAVLLLDSEWKVVYANRTARRISRIAPENLHRETLWELYPEILGSPLERAYREAMEFREQRLVDAYFYEPFQTWYDLRIFPAASGVAVQYHDITPVRQAEIASDQAGEKLRQVYDSTTDAIGSIDREWRCTFLNRRARQLLGPNADQLIGREIWSSFPGTADESSPYLENYHRTMNERVATDFEAYYPEPLNIWLRIMAYPSPDGMIVFFRDITGQRREHAALLASEERYRALTELNPQALWISDAEGRVTYANRTLLEYIGRDSMPEPGPDYVQVFHPDDQQHVVSAWMHSAATGEEYSIEARLLRHADGAARWWHFHARPLRDDHGKVQQWLGVANDVHESRMAVDQLHRQYAEIDRQRRELEATYRGSPIGMALYEPREYRLLRLNDRQAEILGLRPEEALGRRPEDFAPGIQRAHELLRRAGGGEPMLNQQIEGELPTRPGEYRYWNVNYSPIFAEDGSVQAIAGATIEMTQQKRAEAALMQSEKLAAVGRLASSIAHEINNPLESVMNLLYLARQYAVVPEVQRFLEVADRELRRVSIIANQTLRFYRQSSAPRAVGGEDLFSTVLGIYESKLKNQGVIVEKKAFSPVKIKCMEGEIRQVLSNLVGNAIDAMPDGGRLVIRSRAATDWRTNRPGLVLTVADTGYGMEKQVQARIFEAFFTTKGIGGTGLGLWISAEIVERHHGKMRMRSRIGRGTVASLFLPFEVTPEPKADPAIAMLETLPA